MNMDIAQGGKRCKTCAVVNKVCITVKICTYICNICSVNKDIRLIAVIFAVNRNVFYTVFSFADSFHSAFLLKDYNLVAAVSLFDHDPDGLVP